MKVDVQIHIFLTSTLAGDEWSASRPGRFTPGERAPGTHWIEGWVGPKAGLDEVEKRKFLTLPGLELRPLDRPARSQSLYRLRYPRSNINNNTWMTYYYYYYYYLRELNSQGSITESVRMHTTYDTQNQTQRRRTTTKNTSTNVIESET
jgi:hypothetical protein